MLYGEQVDVESVEARVFVVEMRVSVVKVKVLVVDAPIPVTNFGVVVIVNDSRQLQALESL